MIYKCHGKFLLFLPLPSGAGTQSPWGDQKQIGQAGEVQGSQGPSKAMQKPHPLGQETASLAQQLLTLTTVTGRKGG